MPETSELRVFDADPDRVVSVPVREIQVVLRAVADVADLDGRELLDATVHERVCHFCWNEDIVHTDIGDEDYGEYVCSACGSPLPDYLQDVADQMQAGCCDEPILWCPTCCAKVVS